MSHHGTLTEVWTSSDEDLPSAAGNAQTARECAEVRSGLKVLVGTVAITLLVGISIFSSRFPPHQAVSPKHITPPHRPLIRLLLLLRPLSSIRIISKLVPWINARRPLEIASPDDGVRVARIYAPATRTAVAVLQLPLLLRLPQPGI